MKYGKCLFVLTILSLLAASCMTVYAMQPLPYYDKEFSNEQDMIDSLRTYIENYPNEYLYPSKLENHLGVHLEHRRVILPRITDSDFVLESCGYAESRAYIGTIFGVNSCYYRFVNESGDRVLITIDYGENAEQIKNWINSWKKNGWTIKEGVYKGVYYYAYKFDEQGWYYDGWNRYCLTIGDLLISVYDYKPFQESRIDLFTFEKTDLLLPVQIVNNTKIYILIFGIATVILAIFVIRIIRTKKKRNSKEIKHIDIKA